MVNKEMAILLAMFLIILSLIFGGILIVFSLNRISKKEDEMRKDLSQEEKQKILKHRMKIRSKKKRCRTCKYKENIREIHYVLEDTIDYIFYCPWKDRCFNTGFDLCQGCFCKYYEPKELAIDEI